MPAALSLPRTWQPHLMREYSAGRRGDASASGPLLNSREMEIVRLLSHGLTDVEIGAQVSYSPRTVQNQRPRDCGCAQ